MRVLEGFEFRRGNTFIHKLDPRVKLVYSIYMFALAMVYSHSLILAFLFVSTLPLFYVAKSLGKLARSLRGSVILIAFIFIVNYLTLGFERALAMSVRFILIISCFSIFFLTTYPEDFAEALVKLKVPYEFALTFTMAIRFVPSLSREAQIIIDAQRSRGLELEKGSFIKKIRNYIPILIPLIVGAIRRSIKVAEAMESRGFGASPKRTSLRELKLKFGDYFFLLVATLLFMLALYLRYYVGIEGYIYSIFELV